MYRTTDQIVKNPGTKISQNLCSVINPYKCNISDKLLKYIKENGYLYLRTKPSIKRGKEFVENQPLLIQGTENRQYLFCNNTEKKKVCNICLQNKNFHDFRKQSNLPNHNSNRVL